MSGQKKETLKQDTAERLRIAREMAGLSQQQAAKLVGVSRPTITEIEAGRRNVTSSELKIFCDLYDITVGWALGTAEEQRDIASSKVLLAARELEKMSDRDVDKLMVMISAMKNKRQA